MAPGAGSNNSTVLRSNGRLIACRDKSSLAVRASKKLRSEQSCLCRPSPARDCEWNSTKFPCGGGTMSPFASWPQDFARFVYLPRLRNPEVLISAVQDGLGLLLWAKGVVRLRGRVRREEWSLPWTSAAASGWT